MKEKFQHKGQEDSKTRLLRESINYNLIEGVRVDGQKPGVCEHKILNFSKNPANRFSKSEIRFVR